MDILALEAKSQNGAEAEKKSTPKPKPKAAKKTKRIVYFEVEIVDLKTKEKLLLLDKVRVTFNAVNNGGDILILIGDINLMNKKKFEHTHHFTNKSLLIYLLPDLVIIS